MMQRAALVVVLVALAAACGTRQVVVPDAQQAFRQLEFHRVINDVASSAIAANKTNVLSDDATAHVLTVTWQVRDFVEANPVTTRDRVITAFREASQAVPVPLRDQIAQYINAGIAALEELLP
jgi:hypothetical protein